MIIGEPYDIDISASKIKKAKGKPELWAPITKDVGKLLESFRAEYDISEEVLIPLEEQIGICLDDINTTDSEIQTNPDKMSLRFIMDGEGPFIREGKIILKKNFWGHPSMNQPYHASFKNYGGVSKGLQIVIAGSFLQHDDVTVEEIQVERRIDLSDKYHWLYSNHDNILVQKQKTAKGVNVYGEPILIAKFEDFEIPEGVNEKSKRLAPLKLFEEHLKRSICIRFLPKGPDNRQIEEIYLHAAPIEYPNEGDTIFAEKLHG